LQLTFIIGKFGEIIRIMDKYNEVIQALTKFRDERDWKQFHDSKNLALAISIEAAELNEVFLWKNGEEAENVKTEKIKEELADILSFSFLLAEKHNLDIFDIILEKIKVNAEKYPVAKAKGTAKKYDEL
jgi:NTP pyrophosphatase (non-canonical NTP hydrolase)